MKPCRKIYSLIYGHQLCTSVENDENGNANVLGPEDVVKNENVQNVDNNIVRKNYCMKMRS